VQNLIHKLLLSAGFLCLAFFAISQDSIVLRGVSSLRGRYTDKISGRTSSLNKRQEITAAALVKLQKAKPAARKSVSQACLSAALNLLSGLHRKYAALKPTLTIPGIPSELLLFRHAFNGP
jgi:hypothetical protein